MSAATDNALFTPQQIQYWVDHKNDTLVPNIIACVSVTGFFSTVLVLLRFFGRRLLTQSLHPHLSDWFVLAAWVFFIASAVCFALLTPFGGGRHVIYVTNSHLLQVFSMLSEAFYSISMGFLKLSILSLYGSIFPQRKFHIILWGVAVFVTGWSITAFLGAILQCVPNKAYMSSLSENCIDYDILSLTTSSCNVITNVVMIGLPIPLVLKLQTSKCKKTAIIATFFTGCSAVSVSIFRLYELNISSVDGSWTAIPLGYASCIELTVGFLLVSIPTYRPLFMKANKLANGSTAWSWRTNSRGAILHLTQAPYNGTSYSKSAHNESPTTAPYNQCTVPSTQNLYTGHRYAINDDGLSYQTGVATADGELPKYPRPFIHVHDQVELVRLDKSNRAWTRGSDEEMARLP